MFMFIIYVFLLYIGSIGVSFFIKESSKLYKVKNIIGFCILQSILQIGYYPMQYFQISSLWFHLWTFLVLLISIILGIRKIKKEDFKFLKTYEFWFLFVLVFIIIKIIPGMEAGDDSFYMSLFMDNASIDKINTINPRTGVIGKIDNIYLYQGYYAFMSFLYKIQSIVIHNPVSDIFISFRTTMSFLCVIFSSQILTYIKDSYKNNENEKIYFLIQILSVLLVAVLEWCHIYWGSFMLFQIFIPLFMIAFNEYIVDRDNKIIKFVLFIINFASISLASSSLFLFAIVAFGYFAYDLYRKKVKLEDYYFILLPSMVYVSFLFNKLWFLFFFALGYFLVVRYKSKWNFLANRYLKYVLFILPILFFVIGLHGDYLFSIEKYRVGKSILVFNVAISIFILYLLFKKEKINPVLFVFIITFLFFFNPIVEPFVSHYLTSTYVYYRLFYITKNPFVITVIFTFVYDYLKRKKSMRFVSMGYIAIVLLLILNYGYHLAKDTILLENYSISYNYIKREDNYSNALGKELQKLEDGSKVFSVYFAPRIYNTKLITDVARYPDDYNAWYKNILVRVLYREDTITEEDYYWFNQKIKEEKYDYLITYNNEKKLKNINPDQYKIIYANDLFVLIKVEKEKIC